MHSQRHGSGYQGADYFQQPFTSENSLNLPSEKSLESELASMANNNAQNSINSVGSLNSLAFLDSVDLQDKVLNSISLNLKEELFAPGQQSAAKHAPDPRVWSEEEDRILRFAVQEFRNSWDAIAAKLPHRSRRECIQRWERYLKPRSQAGAAAFDVHTPSYPKPELPVQMPMQVPMQMPMQMQAHPANYALHLPTHGHVHDNMQPSHMQQPQSQMQQQQTQTLFGNHIDSKLQLSQEVQLQMHTQPGAPVVEEESIPSIEVLSKMMQGAYVNEADSLTIAGEFPKSTTKPTQWTEELDNKLRKFVEEHGAKNWKTIAFFIDGKTDSQCQQRWNKVLNTTVTKGAWSKEEDALLIEMKDKLGEDWNAIAAAIKGRSVKQCKEHWKCNLDPSLNKGPWTAKEDSILMRKHEKYGNKWSTLSEFLPGRCENDIKMRHKSLLSQLKKAWNPEDEDRLMKLHAREGNAWTKFKKKFPERTKYAIKKHVEKLQKLQDSWTSQQDAELAVQFSILGNEWDLYLQRFPGHTIYTIQSRVKHLDLYDDKQDDSTQRANSVSDENDDFDDFLNESVSCGNYTVQQPELPSFDENLFQDGLDLDLEHT